MKIFKTYDIRGIWEEDINEDIAEDLAKAIASFCIQRNFLTIALARDARLSSPKIYKIVKEVLINQGLNIYELDVIPTPVFYYSTIRLNADFGIMITASHNPKEYNGIKMCFKNALPVRYKTGIDEIERIYNEKSFKSLNKRGKSVKADGIEFYCEHILNGFKAITLPFAVDVSNGPQAKVIYRLARELGIKPVILNGDIDGNFPGHGPNPMESSSLKIVSEFVQKNELNFGVAFDGDGDRIIAVDEKGRIVPLDALFSLFIKHELLNNPGEKIYFDLRFSKVVEETILKYRGVPVKMRVGNVFYKEKLMKEGGLLGGELSGHIMFSRNYCIDDPVFSMLILLQIIKSEKKPLSEILDEFDHFFKSEEINIKVKNPDEVFDGIKKEFERCDFEYIDGMSVYCKGFWFNIRKSNTEPYVRINIEVDSEDILEEKKNEIVKLINHLDKS